MANESIGKTNPRAVLFQVWDAGQATTATADISVRRGAQAIIQLDLTGFTGTFDIQGKAHPDASYVNLPYQRVDSVGTPATAQISTTTITATRLYKILAPMPYMQIVMTRSAGSLAAYVYEYEDETSLSTIAVGSGASDLGKAEDSAHASGDVGVAALAVQKATPADLATDGDYAVVEVSDGLLWTGAVPRPLNATTGQTSPYEATAGSVTKANIKASAGNLYWFRATNKNAAVRWLQFHNKASAPAAAETALINVEIPAGTATQPASVEILIPFNGDRFSTGIGWAISTTVTTFTDSATASEHTVHARYI